jgi:hypothetical protein
MALSLTPEHVKSRKRIGAVGTNPVFQVETTGGLYINLLGKGAGWEVIATGPHRAVARYIAEQRYPNVIWSELSKSDWVDPADFMNLVPKYQELTNRMRSIQGA